jgi:hypothetical protein
MKKVRLIGDIHGQFNDYKTYAVEDAEYSIQVGDFGVGFGQSDYWHETVNDFHASGNHRMIRGNHDNPETCRKEMVGWIADGVVENNVMFVGGAWSIDQDYRTPGYDWWRDEELSTTEMDIVFNIYCAAKPEIMITHDCPTLVAYHMFIRSGLRTYGGPKLHLTRTGELLQRMFEAHQPKFWFFGHWHHTKELDLNGTHFHCLGEMDWVDFDFENLEYIKRNC